ncbi:TPA: hypothetical protein N0F65_004545 [Lagenidium giganteum]|uniref:Trafficking protein particle complex subunit 11 domain-containing protein n=1 Tax=Lagenidium giganteum TaxID=4803 RepID=A0AAV2ZCZ5_9STRA|nr:TPA: hypothetical protein N0F65_004545 [Lagenidium giganteum]
METYGAELKETPYPLIAALGAKEQQTKVLQHVRSLNEEFPVKLRFTSLPIEHRFPVKKEVREKHGTFPNQTQRDLEGYKVQGILKARWLKKHHELLPAVVLLFHEFDPRWSAKDWATQEATMRDQVDQLKRGLSGRECRVLVILVQQVEDTSAVPGPVIDERLASLRKRLETDSKGLTLLRSRDIARGSPVLAKLEQSIRNYADEYYKAQGKRVKRYKKALNKTTHMPLHVRHSFKVAHYYEFRRLTTKVLQHYEIAYKAVMALPLNENDKSADGIGFFQVKTIAEYIHFKLCCHLIFSSGNIKAAVDQLHRHMKVYGRALGPVERVYEHWEWVARQYHVFAQLLSEAVSIRGSLPATGLDADIYKEPYLYYAIAAKYATMRRKAAAKLGLAASSSSTRSIMPTDQPVADKDFVVVPSIFLGGDPVVSEPTATEPSAAAFVKYRHALERSVPHAKRVIHLLEQALHHLSMYIADQKSPRNRLKNRLLVQLGNERLAAGECDKARADLQKAKAVYTAEHWWPQTAHILQQLLVCTFRQGDTAAYIDYSVQLLSPILEEYVPLKERSRVQESLLMAWRQPSELGAPFTEALALPSHELMLDRSRPMFECRVHFNQMIACVKEDVVMDLRIQSHFPSPLTLSKMDLVFTDDRYNMVIYHREQCDELVHDEATGQWFWSLAFLHKAPRLLQVSLRVMGGRPLLKYKETNFYVGKGASGSESDGYLSMSVKCDSADPVVAENPRPYLVDGRVPVMWKGMGSPSFARRKTMFSLAEIGRSFSDLTVSSELDGVDFVEEDGSGHTRGTALAILQPRARAKLEVLTKSSLLTGDFRDVVVRVTSNEDTLQSPTVRATCDPDPQSNSADDAFFFSVQTPGEGPVPVPLDATLQPLDRTSLADLEPHNEQTFRLTVRSLRAMTITMTISLAYTTRSGVQVTLEERFELECRDPFSLSSAFVHDFPNSVGLASGDLRTRESYAVVGKYVNLNGTIVCCSTERLVILGLEFENLDNISIGSMATSGFTGGAVQDHDGAAPAYDTLADGDVRTFFLRLLPTQPAPFVSLGRVKVHWKRAIDPTSDDPTQSHYPVETWLDIPTVSFIETPLTLSVSTPPFGVEGQPVRMELSIKNNEATFHSFRLKPLDDADFLLAGRTNAVEELLPHDEMTIRLGLVPTKTGFLRLPQFEVISVTYNVPLLNAEERREFLFCACLHRRRNDKTELLYREQFERIKAVYPGTYYVCLLNSENGEMIAHSENAATAMSEEMMRTIVGVKRAALQFAATLNQIDSQTVHVKGDDRMFSCYGLDRTILAFYSQMPGVDMELFDCSEADKSVEVISTELNRLVHLSPHTRPMR